MLSRSMVASTGLVVVLLGGLPAAACNSLKVTQVTIRDNHTEIEQTGQNCSKFELSIRDSERLADVVRSLRVTPAPQRITTRASSEFGCPHTIVVERRPSDSGTTVTVRYQVTGIDISSRYAIETVTSENDKLTTTATHYVAIRNGTYDNWPVGCRLVIDRTGIRQEYATLPVSIPGGDASVRWPAVTDLVEIEARKATLSKHIVHRLNDKDFKPFENAVLDEGFGVPTFAMKDGWPAGWEDPGTIDLAYGPACCVQHLGAITLNATTPAAQLAEFTARRASASIEVVANRAARIERTRAEEAKLAPPPPFGTDPRRFAYLLRREYRNTGSIPVEVFGAGSARPFVLKALEFATQVVKEGVEELTIAFGAATHAQVSAQTKRLSELVAKFKQPFSVEVERVAKVAVALGIIAEYFQLNEQLISRCRQQVYDASAAHRTEEAAAARAKLDLAGEIARHVVEVYNEFVRKSSASPKLEFKAVLGRNYPVPVLAIELVEQSPPSAVRSDAERQPPERAPADPPIPAPEAAAVAPAPPEPRDLTAPELSQALMVLGHRERFRELLPQPAAAMKPPVLVSGVLYEQPSAAADEPRQRVAEVTYYVYQTGKTVRSQVDLETSRVLSVVAREAQATALADSEQERAIELAAAVSPEVKTWLEEADEADRPRVEVLIPVIADREHPLFGKRVAHLQFVRPGTPPQTVRVQVNLHTDNAVVLDPGEALRLP